MSSDHRPSYLRPARLLPASIAAAVVLLLASGLSYSGSYDRPHRRSGDIVLDHAQRMIDQGRQTFRYDTFGDEAFWGEDLKLHQAIAGAKMGGVGPGVSPATALSVGLKSMPMRCRSRCAPR
jgi:hypothetical protein